MSNYIDLSNRIIKDSGTISTNVMAGIDETLDWLDEHPDEAPGRTITRTEYRDTLDHAVKVSGYGDDWERGFCSGLTVGGTRVIPDPEPTNAEKLETRLLDLLGLVEAVGNTGVHNMAYELDRAGVKAPGGDDE